MAEEEPRGEKKRDFPSPLLEDARERGGKKALANDNVGGRGRERRAMRRSRPDVAAASERRRLERPGDSPGGRGPFTWGGPGGTAEGAVARGTVVVDTSTDRGLRPRAPIRVALAERGISFSTRGLGRTGKEAEGKGRSTFFVRRRRGGAREGRPVFQAMGQTGFNAS